MVVHQALMVVREVLFNYVRCISIVQEKSKMVRAILRYTLGSLLIQARSSCGTQDIFRMIR